VNFCAFLALVQAALRFAKKVHYLPRVARCQSLRNEAGKSVSESTCFAPDSDGAGARARRALRECRVDGDDVSEVVVAGLRAAVAEDELGLIAHDGGTLAETPATLSVASPQFHPPNAVFIAAVTPAKKYYPTTIAYIAPNDREPTKALSC
jgi:hypothetical protein